MQFLVNNAVLWSHVGIWKVVVEVMKPEFELVRSDSIAIFIEVEIRLAVNHSGLCLGVLVTVAYPMGMTPIIRWLKTVC